MEQRLYISISAPGGYEKCLPTAAIFPRKCGRWHFQIADGRENPAKPRPVDTKVPATGHDCLYDCIINYLFYP